MDNYDLLVMKIIHYFIVKENYSPIIIKGIDVEKELWQLRKEYIKQGIWTDIKLNSLNKPCIVRI